ncbi:MAG: amidohydrolase [Verrucomicrobia bacterium]|nr:amidohydrolase [Verrucomicrobiota bacterium]
MEQQSIEVLRRLDRYLEELEPKLIAFRRQIHQHPDLSGKEANTARFISQVLTGAAIPHRLAANGCGIISETIRSPDPAAPVIALRADIDALPIQEETGIAFRSNNPRVMHACGHDAHAAMLLTTVLALKQENNLPFSWRAIFQPSEEEGQGAQQLIQEGGLENVDGILALHVDPNRIVGKAGITPGPRTAFCRDFVIEVRGRGGHAARPHATIDPVAAAAHLVTLIYQALPRSSDARDPMVVTIGMIQGGHTSNVIPDIVTLKGTIRALRREVAIEASSTLERLSDATAQAFKADIKVGFKNLLNGMVNDELTANACAEVAREFLRPENVICDDPPSLGGEDFADYTAKVPGCMITLGVGFPNRKVTPLHTATFELNEAGLLVGPKLLVRCLLHWSKKRAAM